jgi:3-oxoacyl-[acyl-carrier protein] reductase
MPGAILTENGYWDIIKKSNKKIYNNYAKNRMAIERMGLASEITNFVIFACSEYASFSVGSAFLVDGGQGKSFQQR